MSLIDSLIKEGWLKTPRLIQAFRKIRRADFLPNEMKGLGEEDKSSSSPFAAARVAELNEALLIGYGQTISQPLVVAFMLEQLQPQPGDKILDVGSGSGWTSALLAEIVGEKGKVIAIEVVPELKEFGRTNVAKYNFIEKGIVEFICADGSKGYPKSAPYDKILASASAEKLPSIWKEQIKIGGRIVTPIGSSIWSFIKESETEFRETEYPGFAFVPLITKPNS